MRCIILSIPLSCIGCGGTGTAGPTIQPAVMAPTSPVLEPRVGTVRIDRPSVMTGEQMVVSGTFKLAGGGRRPGYVYITVQRADGVIMTSGSAKVSVNGDTAEFKTKMKAPKKPGSFSVVASLGKNEISKTKISVSAE